MGSLSLDDLRGAILDQIAVNWRNATARLSFLPSPTMRESYALRATDFTRLEIGRSAGAERIVREARRAGPTRVEIDMDGGGALRIEAAELALEPIGGGPSA